jgi:hypothetical protein
MWMLLGDRLYNLESPFWCILYAVRILPGVPIKHFNRHVCAVVDTDNKQYIYIYIKI